MGMWTGLLQGKQLADQRRAAEAEAAIAEENQEMQRRKLELAEEQLAQDRRATRFKTISALKGALGVTRAGTGTGTASKGGTSSDTDVRSEMAVLTQRYGVDEEVVKKLYADGGSSAIDKAYKTLTDVDKKIKSGKVYGDMSSIVGEYFNDAVRIAPTVKEIDYDALEQQLGFEIDQSIRDAVGTEYTIPGTVDLRDPVLIEKVGYDDLNKVDERVVKTAINKSSDERAKILGRLAALTEIKDPTKAEEAEREWLQNRLNLIQDAVASQEDDNLKPIVDLYGADVLNTLIQYDPRLKGAPLDPSLFGDIAPTDVKNMFTYERLYESGIISDGQVITYEDISGETVTETVDRPQFGIIDVKDGPTYARLYEEGKVVEGQTVRFIDRNGEEIINVVGE